MSIGPMINPASFRALLAPINTPVVGSSICNFTGTLFPIYSTFKALEDKKKALSSESKEEDVDPLSRWAMYWAVFGSIRLVESFTDPILYWFPYYYPAKLALLLWLQMTQFRGADVAYSMYIRPALMRYRPKIEIVLESLKKYEWIVEAQRPYLTALFNALVLAHTNVVEFLKWFFGRDSDEKQIENEKKGKSNLTLPGKRP